MLFFLFKFIFTIKVLNYNFSKPTKDSMLYILQKIHWLIGNRFSRIHKLKHSINYDSDV